MPGKGKEIELGAVAESSHVRLSASHVAVAEDSGIYHSGFGAVLMGDEYLRFVTVVEAARAVVVDGGSCAGESVASLPVKPAIAVVKRMVLPLSVPPSGVGASSCEQADNPTTPDRMAIRHIFFFIIFISLRLLNYVVFMDCG